ncbi:CRISPR-associated Cse3 family protein [Prauserella shujinwangii]|uniref:CRISPR-associated Cse3 family protein n=2 Tax=Prauserella shujinwangii TaxID=1453103 RepID=A0A2T0M2W4_9PSEU|nr:CRISPR-associated Cse3 family protein [Prauserella shujinwangii]
MPVNPRRRGARLLLSSPQAMHAAVLAGFPDARPTEEGRVLWRLDTYEAYRVCLFVASPDKPDFTHLVEQAGWPATETCWQTRTYDGLLGSLRVGQRWQFRLTANPVRSVRLGRWADTKPVGHVTVRQQQVWLLDRAERHGFRVADSAVAAGEPDLAVVDRAVRRFGRKGGQVTLSTATFEGHLEVVDPDALRHTLTFGLGRAKSYGCGLLTLAVTQGGGR